MKTIIIGAGGVGSFLTPAVCMLVGNEDVIIVDGDKLEKKNLNRQLFTDSDIGKFKASALAERYGCQSFDRYYSHGSIPVEEDDWLLVAVDNNVARAAALESADAYGCKVIIGCNEVTSSEAYYYETKWKGTPHDPRIYYEDLSTDKRFDPRAADIGCTGEKQLASRQLVSANFMAAGLMQHLLVLWRLERKKFNREAIANLPYRIIQNLSKYETVTLTKGKV